MGSELYAHFSVGTDQTIESDELRELAEDSGAGEVPGAGEEGRSWPLEPVEGQEGSELELWVDATKVKLFDPRTAEPGGRLSPCPTSKASSQPCPPRTGTYIEPPARRRVLQEARRHQVVECWGDDVPKGEVTDFYKAAQAKDDETVIFSWIEYPTRPPATRQQGDGDDPEMATWRCPSTPAHVLGGFEQVVG